MANLQRNKALRTRIVSALIALAFMIAIYAIFRVGGLKFLCFFAVVVGSHELGKLLLDLNWRDQKMWVFISSTLAVFTGAAMAPHYADLVIAITFLVLGVYSLLAHDAFDNLADLQNYMFKALLSLFYLGLFPAFIYRILSIKEGEILFFGFLGIVFAGDIAAYFIGVKWGRRKLIEEVSPKKTVEGALAGLVGSILFAEILSYVLNHDVNLKFLLVGLLVGFVAQAGDFFESLLKRVGKQKDSGAIMPGHGGVLDRLDGVLFSAPIFFLLVSI